MDDRRSKHRKAPRRRAELGLEILDGRMLLSSQVAADSVGPYIAPAIVRPRIQSAPVVVDALPSLNRYLFPLLGQEAMEGIRNQAINRGVARNALMANRVLAQPFIKTFLGAQDTYLALNSTAVGQLAGFVQISSPSAQADTVRYTVEPVSIISVGSDASVVQIPPSGNLPGFLATVPTGNIRLREDGLFFVDVPRDQIPGDAPAPVTVTEPTGELSQAYSATGPLLSQALLTGQHRRGPNQAQVVRGLRLTRYLNNPRLFPVGLQHSYLRLLRVAAERQAFTPTPSQSAQIDEALTQFVDEVTALYEAGVFNPSVPPPTPDDLLPGPPLTGSLTITAGAERDLMKVAPQFAGLPLLGLNFPGRIDVGFVIAPNGDYGVSLTARGPLKDDPAGFISDIIAGDVRVEVSDAQTLTDLNGLRVEEGTLVGTVLSGEITASRTTLASGRTLRVLGASVGYGAGLKYGTGVSYTQVIPLGNLNALIPQFPVA